MKRYFILSVALAFLLSACSPFITPENSTWRITNATPDTISFEVKSTSISNLQSGDSILAEMDDAENISKLDGKKYDYKVSYYMQNKKLYHNFIITAKIRYEYQIYRNDSTSFEYSDTASNPVAWKKFSFINNMETLIYYAPREFKLYNQKNAALLNSAIVQIARSDSATQSYILEVQKLEVKSKPVPHTLGYTYYSQKIFIKEI